MIYFLRLTKPRHNVHRERLMDAIKIGHAANWKARSSQLHRDYGAFELLGLMLGDRTTEKELHQLFSQYHVDNRYIHREWFRDVNEIREYIHDSCNPKLPIVRSRNSTYGVFLTARAYTALEILQETLRESETKHISFSDMVLQLIRECAPEIITKADSVIVEDIEESA